jgi:hypothetical protein
MLAVENTDSSPSFADATTHAIEARTSTVRTKHNALFKVFFIIISSLLR